MIDIVWAPVRVKSEVPPGRELLRGGDRVGFCGRWRGVAVARTKVVLFRARVQVHKICVRVGEESLDDGPKPCVIFVDGAHRAPLLVLACELPANVCVRRGSGGRRGGGARWWLRR